MNSVEVPPEVAALLQAGKLEQSCPACGRWEAAHFYCSWCLRPMGPADWYRNNDLEQRYGHFPAAAPPNPPSEYLSEEKWPEAWGTYPRQKPARQRSTPVKRQLRTPRRISRPKGFPARGLVGATPRLSAAPDGPHTPESGT